MLRSSVIFFTAMLALIFLGKRLYRQHWTSLMMIVLGIFLVGLSTMNVGGAQKDEFNFWGITVLLIA